MKFPETQIWPDFNVLAIQFVQTHLFCTQRGHFYIQNFCPTQIWQPLFYGLYYIKAKSLNWWCTYVLWPIKKWKTFLKSVWKCTTFDTPWAMNDEKLKINTTLMVIKIWGTSQVKNHWNLSNSRFNRAVLLKLFT